MCIRDRTYPELSPYDRQILDQHVRYVGDPVAIVAGENEKCVDQAIKMLRVEYEVLPANLDPRKAMDKDTPLVQMCIRDRSRVDQEVK